MYGFTKPDALILKQVARERKAKPQDRYGYGFPYDLWHGRGAGMFSFPGRKLPALKAYICTPQEDIPGAAIVDTGMGKKLLLGSGIACLQERKKFGEGESRQDPDLAPTNSLLYARRNPINNEAIFVRVFNFCPETIKAKPTETCVEAPPSGMAEDNCCENIVCEEPVLFVVQDMFGDLYIVRDCEIPCTSSSSSSSSSSSESSSYSSSSSSESESESVSSSSGSSSESESVPPGSSSESQSESESEPPSSESNSESQSFSESQSESGSDCDYTGTHVFGKGDLTRVGDYVRESKERVTIRNGKVCKVEPAGYSQVYICCDTTSGSYMSSSSSSSSSESGSENPPSVPSESTPSESVPSGSPPPPDCGPITWTEYRLKKKISCWILERRTNSFNCETCRYTYGTWVKEATVCPCECESSSESSSSSSSSSESSSGPSSSSESSSSKSSSESSSKPSSSVSGSLSASESHADSFSRSESSSSESSSSIPSLSSVSSESSSAPSSSSSRPSSSSKESSSGSSSKSSSKESSSGSSSASGSKSQDSSASASLSASESQSESLSASASESGNPSVESSGDGSDNPSGPGSSSASESVSESESASESSSAGSKSQSDSVSSKEESGGSLSHSGDGSDNPPPPPPPGCGMIVTGSPGGGRYVWNGSVWQHTQTTGQIVEIPLFDGNCFWAIVSGPGAITYHTSGRFPCGSKTPAEASWALVSVVSDCSSESGSSSESASASGGSTSEATSESISQAVSTSESASEALSSAGSTPGSNPGSEECPQGVLSGPAVMLTPGVPVTISFSGGVYCCMEIHRQDLTTNTNVLLYSGGYRSSFTYPDWDVTPCNRYHYSVYFYPENCGDAMNVAVGQTIQIPGDCETAGSSSSGSGYV